MQHAEEKQASSSSPHRRRASPAERDPHTRKARRRGCWRSWCRTRNATPTALHLRLRRLTPTPTPTPLRLPLATSSPLSLSSSKSRLSSSKPGRRRPSAGCLRRRFAQKVALAKILYPIEAKVAMDIAQVDETSEYPLVSIENLACKQGANVDLNEAPFKIQEHLNRMRALSKTVELGKRFFPLCLAVINKIIDTGDLSWLGTVDDDTPEEQLHKKQRHIEDEEEMIEAYTQDKEETDKSSILSSSLSTSMSFLKPNGKLTTSDQQRHCEI